MIDQQTVWREIWPVVELLIQATAAGEMRTVRKLLVPNRPAAVALDLFGLTAFEILLKLVLERDRLGLARAIETEKGRHVYIEYAWLDSEAGDRQYNAVDIVTLHLKRYRKTWRVIDLNPAHTDKPMTEARAQSILLTNQVRNQEQDAVASPWLLPVMLHAGALRLPFREKALRDSVEELLFPGLQQRAFGLESLIAGRRLWRDFTAKARPDLGQPAVWAAASEYLLSVQALREVDPATVCHHYQVELHAMLPRITQIKEALGIDGLHERYSSFGTLRVKLSDQSGA